MLATEAGLSVVSLVAATLALPYPAIVTAAGAAAMLWAPDCGGFDSVEAALMR